MTRFLALILSFLLAVIPAQADMSLLGVGGQTTGGYVGVGDIISHNTTMWWGLRCFKASQASLPNVLIIRRASDNTTTTIGFTAACNLDVATAGTFCAATTCFVNTWYDINGAGFTACGSSGTLPCNITQTTTALQPQLIFNCINTTLPCVQFTGSSSQVLGSVTCTASYCPGSQQSMSSVMERTANFTTKQFVYSRGSGGSISGSYGFSGSVNLLFAQAGVGVVTVAATDSAWHAIMANINTGSTGGQICSDNVCGTAGNTGGGSGTSALNVGEINAGNYFTGNIVEFGQVYNYTYTAAEQREICNNQYLYWGTSTAC